MAKFFSNQFDQTPRGCVATPSRYSIEQLNHNKQHDWREYESLTTSLLNKQAAKLASDQLTSHCAGQEGSSSP